MIDFSCISYNLIIYVKLTQGNLFFKLRSIHLKGKGRKSASINWSITQMSTMTRSGPSRSLELHAGLPCGWHIFWPFAAAFPGTLTGSCLGRGAAGIQTNTHIGCWHHCDLTTTLAPEIHFFLIKNEKLSVLIGLNSGEVPY